MAAAELQAALRDQETGLRGYLISADRQFLTPYYDGQHAEHGSGRRHPAASRFAPGPDRRSGRDREGGRLLAVELCRAADRERDPQRSQRRQQCRSPNAARPNSTIYVRFSIRRTRTWPTAPGARRRRAQHASTTGATGCWAPWCWCSSARRRCWACLTRDAVTLPLRRWPRHAGGSPRATSAKPSAPAAAQGHSATWRSTWRTCGSGSWKSSRCRGRPEARLDEQARRIAAFQRRTRAVRLCRVARSAGTAAQGRLVLSVAREALRRPARRARYRIHRFRGRRSQTHAGAHQRPAQLLPGRPGGHQARRGRPGHHAGRRAWPTSPPRSRNRTPRSCARRSRCRGSSATPRC